MFNFLFIHAIHKKKISSSDFFLDHLYLFCMVIFIHDRFNKTKILEYLRDTWAKDRRAEWSIWMVYSKVEMPHHYLNSGADESSNNGGHRRAPTLWKLTDDVSIQYSHNWKRQTKRCLTCFR